MLKVGDSAPDFELTDQSGSLISLDALVANGDLVLYFYPADFTPVCTREACAFRDSYKDLIKINVRVAGISPQGPESHRGFASQHAIPFPLLCDEGKQVIRAYGVDGLLGFGVRRVTFLVDVSKRIKNRIVADFFVGRHLGLIRKVIKKGHGA